MRGQIMQIPLLYGDGRDVNDLDYTTNMPVNMLVVIRPLKGADGYMRMFPGVKKRSDVAGLSRGVNWNTLKKTPYRVMGGKIYADGKEIGDVPGSDRTPMSHSRNSVAVVTDGTMRQYYYDGTVKVFANWPKDSGTPIDNPQYSWGAIADVTWHRGRYVFSTTDSDTFWVSDLDDESHPDKTAPAHRAETMPDGILAIRTFHDYVACFGSASIELWALTGSDKQIYQQQSSYTVSVGISGRQAVCAFNNSFAFITSPSCGVVTIGYMSASGGAWEDIASNQVRKILETYTGAELEAAICEALTFRSFKLLIVHLPRHTLVFDAAASAGVGMPCWSIIKTGTDTMKPHRAVDFMNEGNAITVGDKFEGWLGELDETTTSQYSDDQEFVLFTQFVAYENGLVNDLELDASTGGDSKVSRLFISVTEDGVSYSQELGIEYNAPGEWLKRVILRKVGRIRTALAFKIRGVGATPATLSRARIRVS